MSTSRLRSSAGLAVFAITLSGLACSSFPPVQSIRAARYYAAGTRALDDGDPGIAIEQLERAAVLRPDASEIHNHLGLAYWADGREGVAEREFVRAVELDCDNEAARVNLARLRAGREGSDESEVREVRGVEGSPSNGG